MRSIQLLRKFSTNTVTESLTISLAELMFLVFNIEHALNSLLNYTQII